MARQVVNEDFDKFRTYLSSIAVSLHENQAILGSLGYLDEVSEVLFVRNLQVLRIVENFSEEFLISDAPVLLMESKNGRPGGS